MYFAQCKPTLYGSLVPPRGRCMLNVAQRWRKVPGRSRLFNWRKRTQRHRAAYMCSSRIRCRALHCRREVYLLLFRQIVAILMWRCMRFDIPKNISTWLRTTVVPTAVLSTRLHMVPSLWPGHNRKPRIKCAKYSGARAGYMHECIYAHTGQTMKHAWVRLHICICAAQPIDLRAIC